MIDSIISIIECIVSVGKNLVKKPLLVLPSIAAVAILFGLLFLFLEILIELMVNVMLLEIVPEGPLYALPFQFIAIYGPHLLAVLAFTVIGAVLFTSLNYWFGSFIAGKIKGQESFGKTFSKTKKGLGKIIAFVIFVILVALVFGTLFWVFALIFQAVPVLGILLIALLSLAAFYLYVKLAFVISALALEKGTVKQAFEQSWNFSQKRFWQILLFLIVVSVLNQLIIFIGSSISELFLDENIEIAILALFWAIALTFVGFALPTYYAKNKLGKSV